MVRPPCCNKLNVKKGALTEEEDAKLLAFISNKGTGNWTSRKSESSLGLKRCGKRWTNYPKPDLKHEGFTQQEEELIIKLHAAVGSRWIMIAHQLPGRTDNEIKNHWNTKLKKKLSEMGIDPVTHKPFSQILADYGNIGGIPRAAGAPKHIGTIKRDFKRNAASFTSPKIEPSFSSYTFNSNSQIPHNNLYPTQNNYGNQTNTSNSLDLLSQLQAITLVTEGPNQNNNFFPSSNNHVFFSQPSPISTATSSTSACSSSYNAAQTVMSPDSFSWHDFLLDEAFPPAPNQAQEKEGNYLTEISTLSDLGSSLLPTQSEMQATRNRDLHCHRFQAAASSSSTSSDASLFLEAMLDQENDMFLNFPGLMEEPLY